MPGDVSITASDKVLPTSMPVETVAAGVIGAVGVAVSEIWATRTGRRQSVAVDSRAAGLAVDASSYLRVDGKNIKDKDRLTGFYRAADGWVFLHGNFPHLRDGLLDMFGAEKETLVNAVAGQDAATIEAEAARLGLCAVVVRDRSEWEKSAQAVATAGLPLIEIERIGDAPAEPLGIAARPLEAIRVLDLTRVIAGPVAGKVLAEHGADVLTVSAPHLPQIEPLVIETGFGKRSAFLDLRTTVGESGLRGLVRDADVFIDSYRPGALAERGFSPSALAAMRPGIIAVSISAFSRAGPWRDRRGYDSLVQAAVGLAGFDAGGVPRRLPCQPLDYMTGYLAAFSAMVAMLRRSRTGGSWHVRLSLERTAAWLWQMADAIRQSPSVPAARPDMDTLSDLLFDTPSSFGLVRHLRTALELGETPGFWRSPPPRLGTDLPVWLAPASQES